MEILQTLLENEILTPETKADLEEAIKTQITEAVEVAVEEAKAEVEANVRAELAEQFVTDKEALVEALDTKAQQFLESELAELVDDVEQFRDLEAEYAGRVVEMKRELAEVAKKDFSQLVNILNEFLEERVTAEFDELKEDIEEVKKIKFGKVMYETFRETFERDFFDKDEIDRKSRKASAELKKTKEALAEAQTKLDEANRKAVLTETLSTLDGRPREIMEAILVKTPTDKIGAVYEQFIGRVLNKSVVEETEEKEETVLAEGSNTQSKEETVKVTGDTGVDAPLNEAAESRLSKEEQQRLRDLSGQLD